MNAHFKRLSVLPLMLALLLVMGTVACSSTQTAGEELDEAAIGAKIKAKFAADPDINPFNIDVDSMNDGVVRLSGTVDDAATRTEAVRLARNTDGVRRVVNDIKVGEHTMGEALDDAAITAKVKTAFGADPMVKALDIDVDTNEGVVHLSGTVSSQAEKDAAGRIAKGTKGVKKVENHLKVG